MTGIDLKCLSGISTVQTVRIAGVDFQMDVYFPQIMENRRDNIIKIINIAFTNENYDALRQMYYYFYKTYENPGKCDAKAHEIKLIRNRCKHYSELIESMMMRTGEDL